MTEKIINCSYYYIIQICYKIVSDSDIDVFKYCEATVQSTSEYAALITATQAVERGCKDFKSIDWLNTYVKSTCISTLPNKLTEVCTLKF